MSVDKHGFSESGANCALDGCSEVVFQVKNPQKQGEEDDSFEYFYVCKIRLAEESGFFREMVSTYKDSDPIPISEYTPAQFLEILNCTFAARNQLTPIQESSLEILLKFSDKYCVPALTLRCVNAMINFIGQMQFDRGLGRGNGVDRCQVVATWLTFLKNAKIIDPLVKKQFEIEVASLFSCLKMDDLRSKKAILGDRIVSAILMMKLKNSDILVCQPERRVRLPYNHKSLPCNICQKEIPVSYGDKLNGNMIYYANLENVSCQTCHKNVCRSHCPHFNSHFTDIGVNVCDTCYRGRFRELLIRYEYL